MNRIALVGSLVFVLVLTLDWNSIGMARQATSTSVKKRDNGGWQLIRDGKPYFVRGAGGDGSLSLLVESGGNSTRTWGVDEKTRERLDEAHRLGVSVTLGIWIEHERHGFNYTDFDSVAEQIDVTLAAVEKFKDHPAVLAWGIGNEMEGANGDNPVIWSHIEYLARRTKELDPHHPTMTVIAEIGANGEKVKAINKLCPSIDIIGVNSYGGGPSLAKRIGEVNSQKPYMVTEFGPMGPWEVGKNSLGAVDEKISSEKTANYRRTYESFAADSNCLGSYVFLWGNKQEATATWFGLLLPDGRKTAALDTMIELWTGVAAKNRCPKIESFTLNGENQVEKGQSLRFTLSTSDPENESLDVEWVLMAEAKSYVTGGDFQKSPPSFSNLIAESGANGAVVKAPNQPGLYRLYAYVRDSAQGAATGNIVFRVKGDQGEPAPKASLPITLYDETGENRTYIPSGFMGDTEGISLDDACRDNPRVGTTCLKNTFARKTGWGGVVWQHPENDWGEKPGGLDLSDATKLTFWARGSEGGERVNVGFGVLGREKTYFDTGKIETEINLTQEWKKFSLDVSKADLTRIKTGFFWSVASKGKPLTFYLDAVQFE